MRVEKVAYFVFVMLMLSVFILISSGHQPARLKKEVEEGKLYEFREDKQYWTQLTDFCVKDDCIYILFGDKGIIKVYDTKGVYKMTYAFPVGKGESSLHTDSNYVYLCDQQHNFYVFSFGECIEFIKYCDYTEWQNKMNTFTVDKDEKKTNSEEYYLRWVSVYKKGNNTSSQIVVYRSPCYVYFQGIIPYAMILLCLFVLFILKLLGA